MSGQSPKRARERGLSSLLIDPFRQIKFGLYVIGGALAFVVITAAMFIFSFWEQYRHVMGIFTVVDPNMQWDVILNDVFYTNARRLAGVFTIFLLGMFYLVFRLTHRYYGPLVSIERFVEEVAGGNYSARVSIRSKDELQDLARKLNSMAEALEKRHPGETRGKH